MKKIKVILSVLLMAAAISFTACSNASSGSSDPSTPAPATTPSTPSSGGSGGGSGSGSGSQTPAVTYIGSKAPTEAKAVGDIVFTDGSATPYTSLNSLSNTQKQAAIAIIFYVGTDLNSESDTTTVRTLGLGLKNKKNGNDLKWCSGNARTIVISTISCTPSGSEEPLTFTGDKNGSDNLAQIGTYLTSNSSTDDTGVIGKYPAFDFAKNYKDLTGNNVSGTAFENGWYLPSIAELYQIYLKGKSQNKAFDLDTALQTLGGNKFEDGKYWSSSQYASDTSSAYRLSFKNEETVVDRQSKSYDAYFCAIRDFTPYTVTLNTTGEGIVSSNKTIATPGETVTLTVTDTTEDNDYDITTFTMNGTTLPALSSNKTVTFTMPAANVTIATTFVGRYVGSKRPSRAKEVGDIVFNDGSSMPYSTFTGLTSTEKDSKKTRAIALIFYKGNGLNNGNDTTTVRTLGVGLKLKNNLKWCRHNTNSYDSEAAKGAYINITTIQCIPSGETGSYTFTGDKYGKDNFEQIAAFLSTTNNDDTVTQGNYPVFEFAKNYKAEFIGSETTRRISDTSEFKDGWYIPSIAELYQIWENGKGARKVFDINEASIALGGDSFNPQYPNFWSSSQSDNSQNFYIYKLRFSDGDISNRAKFGSESMIYACCIREF